MIKKYFKRHAVILTFLSVIFLISIIVGIILYLKSSNETKQYINQLFQNFKDELLNNNINNIYKHLIILLLLFILSFTAIGYLLGVAYLFYEGMSISYSISALCANYALKGFAFGIIYNMFFKFIFIILYIFILLKLFDLVKILLDKVIFKNNINFKGNIKRIVYSVLFIILIIFINDIIIYIFSNFLIKIIINML